ncbi:hypothetical protein SK128_027229, partial [Halocaridina rubra]
EGFVYAVDEGEDCVGHVVVGAGGGVAVRMPGDDRGSPSSLTDFDSALGASTASPDSTRKTHRYGLGKRKGLG